LFLTQTLSFFPEIAFFAEIYGHARFVQDGDEMVNKPFEAVFYCALVGEFFEGFFIEIGRCFFLHVFRRACLWILRASWTLFKII